MFIKKEECTITYVPLSVSKKFFKNISLSASVEIKFIVFLITY